MSTGSFPPSALEEILKSQLTTESTVHHDYTADVWKNLPDDIFAYCGHGAGEKYLGGEGGEKLRASAQQVKATAILMGCSR